jgi:hypothetical protein
MSWTYVIATGTLLDPDMAVAGSGYSGQPPHVNDTAAVDLKNEGPLPPGWYTMGQPVEGTHLGPLSLPLEPDAENEMHGRGGFYCHGDSIDHPGYASDGCIILPRSVRDVLAASSDRRLRVVLQPS